MCGRPFKKFYGVIDQYEGRSALRGFFCESQLIWLRRCWMSLRMPQNGLFFGQKWQNFQKQSIFERFFQKCAESPKFCSRKVLKRFFGQKRSNFELDGQDFVHNTTVFSTLFGRFLAILEKTLDCWHLFFFKNAPNHPDFALGKFLNIFRS